MSMEDSLLDIFECPVSSDGRCHFMELSFLGNKDDRDAVDLIKRTFPHMKIGNFWYDKIRDGDTIIMKENGKKMIGIANVSYDQDASINVIAVEPGYQGSGIGKTLLETAETMARQEGKKRVRLFTEQSKPRNVIFYSRNGYKITGYNKDGYKHCPSIKFEKTI